MLRSVKFKERCDIINIYKKMCLAYLVSIRLKNNVLDISFLFKLAISVT